MFNLVIFGQPCYFLQLLLLKLILKNFFLLQVDSVSMKNSRPMKISRVFYLIFPPRTHPRTQITEFTNSNAHSPSGKKIFFKSLLVCN